MAETENSAEAMVEQGLQLYSQGRLDEAIATWNDVVSQVPDHPRAREYIRYVEDNRTALEASFKLASASSEGLEARKDPEPAGPVESGATEEPDPAEPAVPDSKAAKERAAAEKVEPEAEPRTGGEEDGVQELLETVRLLDEGDPRKTLPLPGLEPVESTARMDVSKLKDNVDRTKAGQRPTPAVPSPAVHGREERSRRPTPLVLVPGEGTPVEGSFEPQEKTPVAVGLPQPARVVSGQTEAREVEQEKPKKGKQQEKDEREEEKEGDAFSTEKTPVIVPPPDLFEEGPSQATPTKLGDGDERVDSMLAGARQLNEQGTHEGSLWLCERVLSMDPENAEARELLEKNRSVLLEHSRKQIGDLTQIPVIQIPQHEIMWHKLDHRAGFLLSRIDGQLSFEDIIDVSGMGEFEASRILSQLLSLGVIGPRG